MYQSFMCGTFYTFRGHLFARVRHIYFNNTSDVLDLRNMYAGQYFASATADAAFLKQTVLLVKNACELSDHLQYSSCGGVQLHTKIVCCSYRYSCVLKIRAQTSPHESICTCRICTCLSNILHMRIRSHISQGLYVDEPVNLDT